MQGNRENLSRRERMQIGDIERAKNARSSDAFHRLKRKFGHLELNGNEGLTSTALTLGDIVDIVDVFTLAHNMRRDYGQELQTIQRLGRANSDKVEEKDQSKVAEEVVLLNRAHSIDDIHRDNPLYAIGIDLDHTGIDEQIHYLELNHLIGFGLFRFGTNDTYVIRLAGNAPFAGYPENDPIVVAIFRETGLPVKE